MDDDGGMTWGGLKKFAETANAGVTAVLRDQFDRRVMLVNRDHQVLVFTARRHVPRPLAWGEVVLLAEAHNTPDDAPVRVADGLDVFRVTEAALHGAEGMDFLTLRCERA